LYHSWIIKVKIYRAQPAAGDGSGQHGSIAFLTLTGGAIMSNSNARFMIIRKLHSPTQKMKLSVYAPQPCAARPTCVALRWHMTLQEQYDDAMFDFSRGDFAGAIGKLKNVLAQEAQNFEAQLALGMALYRKGDFAAAIAEGHKAEKLRPQEQLVHTNLSLFYMKSGDKATAEKHGLQAKIESWREDAAKAGLPGKKPDDNSELQIAKPTPQPMKFPSQPWKKKKVDG
jgi:tetratricopeptide (TPR) repeat protein